ncbi:MAG: TIGR03905 family TSCPD domain-containing protein [Lachnospiraceae bacterium]|nr:TIGR03905 family TSCPD domain-containing protein [Lachnospiraceae bacterium]
MEKTIEYAPKGVCSRLIKVTADDGVVKSVEFVGGCAGNTQGVAKLCAGRKVDELIGILEGTDCKGRGTSCPDQLAKALKTL